MNERAPQLRLLLEVFLLAALCYFFFFFGLSAFGLTGADEPRYAQVAREMLQHHDWVTPTLYGNVWLEKPILYYWGAIVSYRIFGVSDWAARIPGGVFASAMLLFLYAWTRRFRNGSQLDAIVMTASSVFVFAFARAASIDIHLVAPLTIGMLAWWAFYETGHRGWLALFYAMIAIGVLAKGPVSAALAAMVILVFVAIRRDWSAIVRTLWIPGILIFFAIALPWYVAVQHANPGFVREFFITHNLSRFTTNRFQHRQHFWYYIPVLIGGTMPWTVFVIAALAGGIKSLRDKNEDPLLTYLAVWVLIPLIFFSFSQSKLPGYILPSIVPCGLLVAIWLRRENTKPSPVLISVHALLSGAVLAVALLAPYKLYKMPLPGQVLRIAIPVGLIVALVVAIVVFLRGYAALRFATIFPVALALAFLLKAAGPAIDSTQSIRPVAARITNSFATNEPVMFYNVPRGVEYGLAFYLDRPLPEPPPDEIVRFGTAAAGNQQREKTLKDISNSLPPNHGNYVLVTRAGAINRFADTVPPNYQIEPFFRFQPQRLDVYFLRDIGPGR
ncbi:glycosyl transferase, family 39 [Candidatus Koribacter versatilis Ellin345]|uniref:Glycosyl transferase, family 39 n=1 Tax=Koribacter versatilis (strain Ellin345) TaxID=204669 RepID=Q1IIT8_KORVE|nr:glycosyltransferase family 39 protein [Candidatus Koribacter versatilis]ABF43212.1 glycosyl transferase, family 39 [Candidatus Koribacter versatilis Ellin345]